MDFLRIIRSLEEFLYEVMSWLVFYPRTMWRAVRHPMKILHYSQAELRDEPDKQFTDLLSPPLFLMITILVSHFIEMSAHQALTKTTTAIGRQIVASEQNLLMLRSVLFAIYPLMFAVRRIKHQKLPLDRETLRKPFFAQCYIAAPAALAIGIGTILGRTHSMELQVAGLFVSVAAIGWYIGIEATWLKRQARIKWFPALRSAFATWFWASILNSVISLAVLGA